MTDKNAAGGAFSPEEVRKLIVEALNIGHLTIEEQDEVMGNLASLLMERATLAVLGALPAEEFDRVDGFAEQKKDAEMMATILRVVPNAQQIAEDAIKAGLEEYKQLVNEQVARREAAGAGAR